MYYNPNRRLGLALPIFLVMLLVYIDVASASYSSGYFSLPLSSIETIIDDAANVSATHGKERMISSCD